MFSNYECLKEGHQNQKASHICSYPECDLNILLCKLCIAEEKHKHSLQQTDHLITLNQFKELSLQGLGLIDQYNKQKEIVERCQSIVEDLQQNCIRKLQEQRNFQELEQLMNRINTNDFFQIDKESIQQILFLKDEINLQRSILAQMKLSYVQILEELLLYLQNDEQDSRNDRNDRNIYYQQNERNNEYKRNERSNRNDQCNRSDRSHRNDRNDRNNRNDGQNYQTDKDYSADKRASNQRQISNQKVISDVQQQQLHKQQNCTIIYEQKYDQIINTAIMSPDEKFLVYGGYNNFLTVVDLRIQQIAKEIPFESPIMACRFTSNSNLLFAVELSGHLHCFDEKFEQKYIRQLHEYVQGIKIIDDQLILSYSNNNKIQMSDLEANKQFLIKVQPTPYSQLIGADYLMKSDIIIGCTNANDINLFRGQSGYLIFRQRQVHREPVQNVQVIEDNQSIMSANRSEIILWQIDRVKARLNRLYQISLNMIDNIYLTNNGKYFIVTTQFFVHLLDQSLNKVSDLCSYDNNLQEDTETNLQKVIQPYSMKQIIILQKGNYFISKIKIRYKSYQVFQEDDE